MSSTLESWAQVLERDIDRFRRHGHERLSNIVRRAPSHLFVVDRIPDVDARSEWDLVGVRIASVSIGATSGASDGYKAKGATGHCH